MIPIVCFVLQGKTKADSKRIAEDEDEEEELEEEREDSKPKGKLVTSNMIKQWKKELEVSP